MKTKNKVIKLFLKEKKSKTIREISKKIKADYRITHTAVQRLLKENILLAKTIGKSTLCRLNESYYGIEIYKAENERKEELLKNTTLKQLLKESMQNIRTSFFICLLFGSYAKGTQTKTSDIDLMFISNDKQFEERISDILALIPLKTHALVFTEDEFIQMKDGKNPNVVREALENRIILYGIESFYKLCSMIKE